MSDIETRVFRQDKDRPGIIRFDDDPTAGILVGVMAAEVVKRWNAYSEAADTIAALRRERDEILESAAVALENSAIIEDQKFKAARIVRAMKAHHD